MPRTRKLFPGTAAFAACLAFIPIAHNAAAEDLSKNYTWKPVRIGSGGFVRGLSIYPKDPIHRYARADVDNIYRWDHPTRQWVPLKVASAFGSQIGSAPTSGAEGSIAIDPNNPDIVLAAYTFTRSTDLADTSPNINMNVYRSTDGGRTFTPGDLSLPTSLTNETRGERLAIDPNNSNLVYFGTPGNGLWRSLDGGVHWENIVTGDGLLGAATDVALPRFDEHGGTAQLLGRTVSRYVYLTLTGGAVLQSRDGGVHWANISSGQAVDGKPGFATVDSEGSLWIADGSYPTIYKHTRSGHWTTYTTPTYGANGIAVDPSNPKRLFVITYGGALSRSLDGGRSWTDLGPGLFFSEKQKIEWLRPSDIRPQQHYISTGGIYFDVSGRLWVPGANDGVVHTTPNDATDTAANPPVWQSDAGIEELVAQNSVIPQGGKPILTAEDETLFTINDPDKFNASHYDVQLWGYLPKLGYNNNGLSSAQDITYTPNQPRYVAVASDNFFAGDPQKQQFSGYSDDGGDTWNLFPSITYGTNPCILWGGAIGISARPKGHEGDAAGADNIVRLPASNFAFGPLGLAPFYSKDGGATWTQTTSFDHVTDPNTGSSAASHTPCENNQNSYTYLPLFWGDWVGALVQHSVVADTVTPGTFYLNLDAGGFWKSTDGGVTWSQPAGAASLPLRMHHGKMAAVPGAAGHLWLVDGREGATAHGLYHTTDGGNTFKRNPNFDFAWALALGKAAPGSDHATIYVYGLKTGDGSWGIFQSTDNGATFDRVSYYPLGITDYVTNLSASWDEFGTVYAGFNGNSYAYSTYRP